VSDVCVELPDTGGSPSLLLIGILVIAVGSMVALVRGGAGRDSMHRLSVLAAAPIAAVALLGAAPTGSDDCDPSTMTASTVATETTTPTTTTPTTTTPTTTAPTTTTVPLEEREAACAAAITAWIPSVSDYATLSSTLNPIEVVDVLAERITAGLADCDGIALVEHGTAASPDAGRFLGVGYSYTAQVGPAGAAPCRAAMAATAATRV
jgi:hypothetical protein